MGMGSDSPNLGDFVRDGTSTSHTTHKREIQRIQYRWHPLYQQDILVTRKFERFSQSVIRGRLADIEQSQDGFDLPCWMFDKAYCSSIKQTQYPYVNVESLSALFDFLDLYLSQANIDRNNSTVDEQDNITHEKSSHKRKSKVNTAPQANRTVRVAGDTKPVATNPRGTAIGSYRANGSNASGTRAKNNSKGGKR